MGRLVANVTILYLTKVPRGKVRSVFVGKGINVNYFNYIFNFQIEKLKINPEALRNTDEKHASIDYVINSQELIPTNSKQA